MWTELGNRSEGNEFQLKYIAEFFRRLPHCARVSKELLLALRF